MDARPDAELQLVGVATYIILARILQMYVGGTTDFSAGGICAKGKRLSCGHGVARTRILKAAQAH